ncbi:hypothetical protein, partial [Acidithiobacillus ferrooxidans]|uniref:hypothetical protein n=1 Tax=Acidithiobacillus ferrooxidans TaxID=920 RepID=UPI00241D95D1
PYQSKPPGAAGGIVAPVIRRADGNTREPASESPSNAYSTTTNGTGRAETATQPPISSPAGHPYCAMPSEFPPPVNQDPAFVDGSGHPPLGTVILFMGAKGGCLD